MKFAGRDARHQFYGMIEDPEFYDVPRRHGFGEHKHYEAQVGYMGTDINIHQMGAISPYHGMRGIDMEPAILTTKEWHMSGADIFRQIPTLGEEKKLFLADASDHALLETLMAKQQPKQDEIRERLRLQRLREGDIMPHQTVEAQIIKLANWR